MYLSRLIGRSIKPNSLFVQQNITARLFHQSLPSFSHDLVEHVDSPDNNATTYFDFTEENYERVNKILSKYPKNFCQASIIPLLDLAQRQNNGFLILNAMDKVAEIAGVDPMTVYEVATFYTMFNRFKRGKYFIQLCGTTPCMVCGSEEIKRTIQTHLHLKDGEETSEDGLFTLREVECLGSCVNAPMLQLNDDYYECLTPQTTIELLEACKKGEPPQMGKWGSLPMNGQISCEGPLGKTSLFCEPVPPPMRQDLERKVDPAEIRKKMFYK